MIWIQLIILLSAILIGARMKGIGLGRYGHGGTAAFHSCFSHASDRTAAGRNADHSCHCYHRRNAAGCRRARLPGRYSRKNNPQTSFPNYIYRSHCRIFSWLYLPALRISFIQCFRSSPKYRQKKESGPKGR